MIKSVCGLEEKCSVILGKTESYLICLSPGVYMLPHSLVSDFCDRGGALWKLTAVTSGCGPRSFRLDDHD